MIELQDICKTYRTTKVGVQALRGISLKIEPGEFVAIKGPSGSGKSTLLHILGLLDRADSGLYTLCGQKIHEMSNDELALFRNKIAGFVFQQFHLLPRIPALENVKLPLIYAGIQESQQKAKQKLDEVGLAQRANHCPNELSGGEQQRVAIARALVNEPVMILADEPTGNLDTKSAEEILSILEQLNQKGNTIIMVTHEKDIARRAGRIISMHDGLIVSDERRSIAFAKKSAPQQKISVEKILSAKHALVSKVKFIGHFRQAVQAIVSHKLRSFLSALGILIGIGAVIAMLAVVEGASADFKERLSRLGSNLLMVMPGAHRARGVAFEAGSVTRLTLQDAKAIEKLPRVSMTSASVRGRGQVVYGNKNWNTRLQGEDVNYQKIRNETPIAGRFFTEEELRMRERVALVGVTVLKELFGDTPPINATIKINRKNFRVIGVLPQKGSSGWHDRDDYVVIPLSTAMHRVFGKKYIDYINVEVGDPTLIADVKEQIQDLIVERHHLKKDDESSFSVYNIADVQEAFQKTIKTLSMLFGFIAAISLLVGGIGIMNIMLVSITERTREIGLRKALGARAKEIMAQFLVESVVMTVTGGVLGILFGISIALVLSKIAGWLISITAFSIALATISAIAIGIGFGLWPAHQAAKLDPIEALRYE